MFFPILKSTDSNPVTAQYTAGRGWTPLAAIISSVETLSHLLLPCCLSCTRHMVALAVDVEYMQL